MQAGAAPGFSPTAAKRAVTLAYCDPTLYCLPNKFEFVVTKNGTHPRLITVPCMIDRVGRLVKDSTNDAYNFVYADRRPADYNVDLAADDCMWYVTGRTRDLP